MIDDRAFRKMMAMLAWILSVGFGRLTIDIEKGKVKKAVPAPSILLDTDD